MFSGLWSPFYRLSRLMEPEIANGARVPLVPILSRLMEPGLHYLHTKFYNLPGNGARAPLAEIIRNAYNTIRIIRTE